MTEHGLTPLESVDLLTAWVTRLAADHDVRAFVIKGPLMAIQGLREPRASGDVDLWVDPGRIDDYCALLESHDWARLLNDRPSILPVHARTMRHPRWGCELDVHDRFPGFFADRADVFDRLWEHRASVELAGVPVTTLTPPANALVLALHLLRDLRPGRPDEEYWFLVGVVNDLPEGDRQQMAELAAACGANDALAPFLGATGLPTLPGPAPSARDLQDWQLLTRTHGAPTVYWLHRLSRTPWWRWPAVLWRAVWMTDQQIRDERGATTQAQIMSARLRRFGRGLATLPRALRLLRSRRDDA